MATLGVITFASISEVDVINSEDEPWESSEDEDKTAALVAATLYLQKNYNCKEYSGRDFEQSDVPQVLKDCCALVANGHLSSDVFTRQDGLGNLEETEVKAGPVTTRKKYKNDSGYKWVDPFPNVTAMLLDYYPLKNGSSVVHIARA